MKTAFIMPTTDFFVRCPYCNYEGVNTNTEGVEVCPKCSKKFFASYDRDYFMNIVENNIH